MNFNFHKICPRAIISFKQTVDAIESRNQEKIPTVIVTEKEKLKDTLKSALSEVLAERRAWLTSILFEVVQDYKK